MSDEKVNVKELAADLNIQSRELMRVLRELGVPAKSTVSMIALGDIVCKIGTQHGVPRCRRANLMDCGGLCLTSLAPWTVHAVYPVTLAMSSVPGLNISPVQVVTHNFYGIFMVILILFAILTGYGYREETEDSPVSNIKK